MDDPSNSLIRKFILNLYEPEEYLEYPAVRVFLYFLIAVSSYSQTACCF
jgi:hypothetical protein